MSIVYPNHAVATLNTCQIPNHVSPAAFQRGGASEVTAATLLFEMGARHYVMNIAKLSEVGVSIIYPNHVAATLPVTKWQIP